MALTRCPECNKQVPDKAPACPNCGAPIGNQTVKTVRASGGALEGIGFLLVAGGVVAVIFGGSAGPAGWAAIFISGKSRKYCPTWQVVSRAFGFKRVTAFTFYFFPGTGIKNRGR